MSSTSRGIDPTAEPRVRHWLQEFDRRLTPARPLLGFRDAATDALRDSTPAGAPF